METETTTPTTAINTLPLPLSLAKRSSILDGIVMLEKLPIERIKALLKSDLLLKV